MNSRLLIFTLLWFSPLTLVQALDLNDSITLSPSKIEITADPNQSLRREFTIKSYTTEDLNVSLRFENLVEGDASKYPLTPYLSASKRNFTLPAQGQVIVPIIINLPADIPPGGFYGTALFSITQINDEEETGEARVVTRLAPLLFLRVNGEVKESGSLLDAKFIDQTFYLTYENTGNIYLNPYGVIEVKNKLSKKQFTLQVDPWFVLPGATRIREIELPESLGAGWYEAKIKLHRGYGEITDTREVNFFVVTPTTLWLAGLILLLLIILLLKRFRKIFFIILLIITFTHSTLAQVASSTNYRLQADSLNFSGGLSNSTNYNLENTLGELATGPSTSTNYGVSAGYQQMISSSISITAPSDVSLNGITGTGASSGTVAWTVTTDNSAGYTLSIKAGSNPALTSGSESFSNYSPSGANPDYNWSVGASASAFGFSIEGADTASRYLDNSSGCGVGASNASDQCWDGFSTSDRTIAQSSGGNAPNGIATTVKLKAEIGSSKTQPAGNYSATLTVTATPR